MLIHAASPMICSWPFLLAFKPVAAVTKYLTFGYFCIASGGSPGPDLVRHFGIWFNMVKLKGSRRSAHEATLALKELPATFRTPVALVFALAFRILVWHDLVNHHRFFQSTIREG